MMQRPQEVADILDNAVEELLESLVAENGISNSGGGVEEVGTPTLAHAGEGMLLEAVIVCFCSFDYFCPPVRTV